MENKTDYQAELFSNRLQKKYRELRKWARKNRISCYRLYDRDIPEIPVSLDLYEFLPDTIDHTIEAARFMSEQNAKLSANIRGIEEEIKQRTFAVIYLYERPYQKDEHEEEIWLEKMSEQCCKVLGIEKSHIIKKMRKHFNHNAGNQYKKENTIGESDSVSSINGLIQEQGQLFRTDLTTYLDTGLFFDHRPLRSLVRETCSNKRVLNLFCYTGSFSVYAAQGNASYIESVDLSNTYLDWAKENMKLNGFSDKKKYVYTKTDCIRFLQEKATGVKSGKIKNEELYDLIILDPPTFSNSKSTQDVLDINRDWPQLVKDCLNILTPGGILYFSTNSERIKFDLSKLPSKTAAGIDFNCNDITYQTIPQDFERKKPHKCWQFKLV
ncbi:MAG: class I SAM-dependent methyltransferase [Treponema sp.]|nr:class I SAM-dependent methyltransferase [Treponema sp.]